MVNRVSHFFSYLLIGGLLVFVCSSWIHTPKLIAKVDNAILQTFEITSFEKEVIMVDTANYPGSMINLSEDRLFRIIKNDVVLGYGYLGETASMKRMFDYLILFNTDLSIKEIAYQTGFEEPTNFVKYFKKEVGMTPSVFRKEY